MKRLISFRILCKNCNCRGSTFDILRGMRHWCIHPDYTGEGIKANNCPIWDKLEKINLDVFCPECNHQIKKENIINRGDRNSSYYCDYCYHRWDGYRHPFSKQID